LRETTTGNMSLVVFGIKRQHGGGDVVWEKEEIVKKGSNFSIDL